MEGIAIRSGGGDQVRMIVAKGVSKVFTQGAKAVNAVKDVSLEINQGENVYIHGPSGAGKSTLLHILSGLNAPTTGIITFQDKNIYNLSDRKRSRLRNKHFGFIFQFYHLLPELNVLENVMLPAMINGEVSRKTLKSTARELLESIGMGHRLEHRPNQLSGGETQRAAIARALVNSPSILFCDEPTGNLDSEMGSQIYALLYNVSKKNNMSVVIVSHEKIDKKFFDSEYVMQDGVLESYRGVCNEGIFERRIC